MHNVRLVSSSSAARLKTLYIVAAIMGLVFSSYSVHAATRSKLQIKSPTGELTLDFVVDTEGIPTYAVHRGATSVLLPSRLGFDAGWASGFTDSSNIRSHHDGHWKPVYGGRNLMPDVYNELTVGLAQSSGRALTVQLRSYDEGIAIRYSAPGGLETNMELTEGPLFGLSLSRQCGGWLYAHSSSRHREEWTSEMSC